MIKKGIKMWVFQVKHDSYYYVELQYKAVNNIQFLSKLKVS